MTRLDIVDREHPEIPMQRTARAGRDKTVRRRSSQTVFGLPLIDIAYGPDPSRNEKHGNAKGIIAIGDRAEGVLAMGGRARGLIALGGRAIGMIAMGGMSAGLIAMGGLAVGAVAVGGLSLGLLAAGKRSAGLISVNHRDPPPKNYHGWHRHASYSEMT
jgi:hypothetical protein